MVNFNNESTVTTPAGNIMKIMILEARYNLLDAIENQKKLSHSNIKDSGLIGIIKSRLWRLYAELRPILKNRNKMNKQDKNFVSYEQIENTLNDKNITVDDLVKIFYYINEELDLMKLTAIDTAEVYDNTRVENENEVKGL
jgi:hypothetical protein